MAVAASPRGSRSSSMSIMKQVMMLMVVAMVTSTRHYQPRNTTTCDIIRLLRHNDFHQPSVRRFLQIVLRRYRKLGRYRMLTSQRRHHPVMTRSASLVERRVPSILHIHLNSMDDVKRIMDRLGDEFSFSVGGKMHHKTTNANHQPTTTTPPVPTPGGRRRKILPNKPAWMSRLVLSSFVFR